MIIRQIHTGQMIELIESSTNAYSLDDVLSKIVGHYNSTKIFGPVKREPQVVKQSDGKDGKKKSDKPAVANPAISNGDASSVTCQICSMNHNATNCPRSRAMMQEDAVKRGEHFPGKSDKDGKRKVVKAGKGFESNEDTDDKFCLLCSKLRYMPRGAAKTNNTQDCRQLAKFNRQLEEGVEVENTSLIRRENYAGQRASLQKSYADQSQSQSAQYPYYDVQTPYISQYHI